jgi:hypothetical protein
MKPKMGSELVPRSNTPTVAELSQRNTTHGAGGSVHDGAEATDADVVEDEAAKYGVIAANTKAISSLCTAVRSLCGEGE